MRRGLKERVLDMALGDLLPHTRSGRLEPGQRRDVRTRTCDRAVRRRSLRGYPNIRVTGRKQGYWQ